ncbi:MAG: SGNH/GDSL hydrolase family protein [Candidatus Zixiibacteriota bacterium]
MPKKYSLTVRLAAAVTALIIFVALAEIVLRAGQVDDYFQNRFFVLNRALDYPDVFRRDHDLFWRFHPDRTITSRFFQGRTYHINKLGLRGSDIATTKTAPRLITLGNSCTFGWGVPPDETYPRQLEKALGGRYEVINGAIPGYSSYQGKKFFEHDLLKLQPDIVTVLFAWNDHWAAAAQIPDKDQQLPPEIILGLQNFFSRFHFYRFLKKTLLSAVETDPDSTFDRSHIVYRVGLEDYKENLKEICSFARERGAVPILLTSPIPALEKYYSAGARSSMHAFHERYNEIVRAIAAEDSVALVDLAREFDRYDSLWDDAVNDPIHFNARGHDLAAQLIADYIRNSL